MANVTHLVKKIDVEMSGGSRWYMATTMQGDRGTRYISARLLDEGEKYTIPEDVDVNISIRKPDGNTLLYACAVSDDDRVIFELTRQALAVIGTLECNIEISSKDMEEVIRSCTFEIEVESTTRDDDEIVSSSEYTALEKKVKEANDLIELFKVQIARLNSVIAAGGSGETTCAETVMIRTDIDGETWETAADRVDALQQEVRAASAHVPTYILNWKESPSEEEQQANIDIIKGIRTLGEGAYLLYLKRENGSLLHADTIRSTILTFTCTFFDSSDADGLFTVYNIKYAPAVDIYQQECSKGKLSEASSNIPVYILNWYGTLGEDGEWSLTDEEKQANIEVIKEILDLEKDAYILYLETDGGLLPSGSFKVSRGGKYNKTFFASFIDSSNAQGDFPVYTIRYSEAIATGKGTYNQECENHVGAVFDEDSFAVPTMAAVAAYIDEKLKNLGLVEGNRLPDYEGETSVLPSFENQVLPTRGTSVNEDIEVQPIKVTETSNSSGGTTVSI